MRHLRIRRTRLIVGICLLTALVFAPAVFGGLASSPLGFKPLAGLGSCPLGAVHAQIGP